MQDSDVRFSSSIAPRSRHAPQAVKSQFKVIVADNYHYMDREAAFELPPFDDLDRAIAACKKIVDDFLASAYEPGMTAESLYSSYTSFGEDPYIVSEEVEGVPFSAWKYAREQASILVAQKNAESD
jgi:hypothetical protein